MDIRDVSRPTNGGLEIDIIVSPNSDRQGAEGIDEWRKRLVIRVRSPPMDGKANKEIEEFMREITECNANITKGHRNRQKTVMIHGNPDEILNSLESLI